MAASQLVQESSIAENLATTCISNAYKVFLSSALVEHVFCVVWCFWHSLLAISLEANPVIVDVCRDMDCHFIECLSAYVLCAHLECTNQLYEWACIQKRDFFKIRLVRRLTQVLGCRYGAELQDC